MKLLAFIAIAILTFATSGFATGEYGHAHDHKPRHGGMVLEINDIALEILVNASKTPIYVREHGEPVDVSRASAKLTLLAGAQTQEVELKLAGDALEATGGFKVSPGVNAFVVVTLSARPVVSARFAFR